METIHTDAAYKANSRKNSDGFEAEMSLEQPVHHDESRMLINVNDRDEIHNINTEVICFHLLFCDCLFALIYVMLSLQ